jgi:hypothetical protein
VVAFPEIDEHARDEWAGEPAAGETGAAGSYPIAS